VHPTGRFLYVVELQTFSGSFDGSVWSYAIDDATGALSPIGAPLPTGVRTRGLAIDPDGRHLYAANGTARASPSSRSTGDSGLLTPLGAPAAAPADVRTLLLSRDGASCTPSSGGTTRWSPTPATRRRRRSRRRARR
jgi:6-phosphogluconolactonase (cycloisomerase 2 family)